MQSIAPYGRSTISGLAGRSGNHVPPYGTSSLWPAQQLLPSSGRELKQPQDARSLLSTVPACPCPIWLLQQQPPVSLGAALKFFSETQRRHSACLCQGEALSWLSDLCIHSHSFLLTSINAARCFCSRGLPTKNSFKVGHRVANDNTTISNLETSDFTAVGAGTYFDDRHNTLQTALKLNVALYDNGVGKKCRSVGAKAQVRIAIFEFRCHKHRYTDAGEYADHAKQRFTE